MAKSYAVKMAEAIEARLTGERPFKIIAEPTGWKGTIFVEHPNGVDVMSVPLAADMRKSPTSEAVDEEIRRITYRLTPQTFYTPEWQVKFRAAHDDWIGALLVAKSLGRG